MQTTHTAPEPRSARTRAEPTPASLAAAIQDFERHATSSEDAASALAALSTGADLAAIAAPSDDDHDRLAALASAARALHAWFNVIGVHESWWTVTPKLERMAAEMGRTAVERPAARDAADLARAACRVANRVRASSLR